MKRVEIDIKDRRLDLFYPNSKKRDELKKRKAQISDLPQDFIANLEIEKFADCICKLYHSKVMDILTQLCCDVEVINYRLDILEDFLNIPTLAPAVKKIINIMIENDRKNIYQFTDVDSFMKLDQAITAFDAYLDCVDVMHTFKEKYGDKVKSEGIKDMLLFFEETYESKDCKKLKNELDELKSAIHNRIKSVTVAINLDDRLVPISAGIVNYSDTPYVLKKSLFDRIVNLGISSNNKNLIMTMKSKYKQNNMDDEKIINTADKALFESLSFLSDGYIAVINDVLKQYQKIDFEDMNFLSYQLEYYLGAINLINIAKAEGLEMSRPKILPMGQRKADIKGLFDVIYLNECRSYNLRNKDNRKEIIANDITFDDDARFYILTGANNGGKTTFVRAMGLCQVMAQAGLYVPASHCEISLCDFIYTHFPKEEQIGIDTSRFTTEIKEFKTISDTITENSLLLMNESIQSTTPNECVDIASEISNIFCIIGVRGIFVTHLLDLAEKVDKINSSPNIRSKAKSIVATIDEQSGKRMYKIKPGMPMRISYAANILREFGIDSDEVIKRLEKN